MLARPPPRVGPVLQYLRDWPTLQKSKNFSGTLSLELPASSTGRPGFAVLPGLAHLQNCDLKVECSSLSILSLSLPVSS